MLRYDANWLLEYYRDERTAAPGIPYAPLDFEGPYTVVKLEQPLRLTQVIDLRTRLAYDEQIVRLAEYGAKTLRVQRCAYSDGIKSNYAMDGPGELRALLRADYGAKLPPLSDARLANGIGTAVVVFDAALHPYLPRRAPRQSVFPGIDISLTVEGSYANIRRFIHDVETSRRFIVIDSVELESVADASSTRAAESSVGRNQLVSLRLDMSAYFRRSTVNMGGPTNGASGSGDGTSQSQ